MNASENMFSLEGQVALVTGGNGGLGFAIAEALGNAGASVAIVARNEGKTEEAVARLHASGIAASGHVRELGSEAACQAAATDVLDSTGRLDILVNCAGVNIRKRPEDYEEEEILEILSVDLIEPFQLRVAAYRLAMRKEGGSIINIG